MVESCIKIPIFSLSKDFLNDFSNSSEYSNELLPSARIIFSSQEPDQIPLLNGNLENLFQQLPHDLLFIEAEQIENALRIPPELRQSCQLSAHSARAYSSSLINASLESGFRSLVGLNLVGVLPLPRDLSQYKVILELLDIPIDDLEKLIQYKKMLKETIQRRKKEMEQWNSRIQSEIRENKHQCRQLFELLKRKKKVISEYCREKKQQLKAKFDDYRARNMAHDLLLVSFIQAENEEILENFPKKYSAGMKRLNERIQEIESEGSKQDKKIQEKKAMLGKKYEERQRSRGKKKSLLFYELCLMIEIKRQFELQKDLRDVYVTFLREIKPTDEEERVLNIELIMREIYRRGENLMALMNWVDLKEEEGPLKVNEKVGFSIGNPNPIRIALTIDKFFVVYRMDLESSELSFEQQMKMADVELRRDERNLNIMCVKEVKSGLLWNKENEFFVELGNGEDVTEFIEDFEKYY